MSAYRCYHCGKYFTRKISDYRAGTLTHCYECTDKNLSRTAAPIVDDLANTINTMASMGMALSSVLDSVSNYSSSDSSSSSDSFSSGGGGDYGGGGSSGDW